MINLSFRFWRKACLACLSLLALAAAHADPVTQIKVMSFNIWRDGSQGGLANCIEAIQSSGADVVGLQECNATAAQTIATQLGFYVLPASDCSIVSRYPILSTYVMGNSRGVTVQLSPTQRAHVFNCHPTAYPYGPYDLKNGQSLQYILDQEHAVRMPAVNQVLTVMKPLIGSSDPCFLVGDFNAPSHLDYANFPWPTSLACSNAGLTDSYRELHPSNRTFPAPFAYNEPGITWTPKTSQEPEGVFDRIDFVHYSPGDGATPTESIELDERNSKNPWPSDHRAVLTTFSLAAPVAGANASNPFPADGAANVPTTTLLMWTPASNALSHAVYFGTNTPLALQTQTTNSVFSPGALVPGCKYFWRIDTTTESGLITGDVWSFTTYSAPVHTSEWTFALGDLQPALGNSVLAFRDVTTSNLTTFGTTDGTTVPHIAGKPARYMRVPQMPAAQNGYSVTFTESGPNGGGSFINQYTVVQDLLIPAPLSWTALFNTAPSNNNDADFYVSDTGGIGSTPGYSGSVISPNTWYRIVNVTDLAAGTMTYYVNGTQVRKSTGQALDGRWALYSNSDPGPDLALFNEGDSSGNYTHLLFLNAWAFVDRALTAQEVAALGGPKAVGIFSGPTLQTTTSTDGTNVILNWTGGKGPFSVERTTSLGGVAWQPVTPWSYERTFIEPFAAEAAFYRVVGN